MVIGDELPTMPGQAQVVLGPDPKLIFKCSCVYNFVHALLSHFHHLWEHRGRGRGRGNPGYKAEGAHQDPHLPPLGPPGSRPWAQSAWKWEVSAKLEPRGAWKPPRTKAGSPGRGKHTEEKGEEQGGEGVWAHGCCAVWPGASALISLGFSLLVCEPGLLCILNWKFSESQNFCPKSPSGAWSWQRPSPI